MDPEIILILWSEKVQRKNLFPFAPSQVASTILGIIILTYIMGLFQELLKLLK